MEIKATLSKPYTDAQRMEFIVEQNHRQGYEIKETGQALEAWGLTAEEIAVKEKEAQRREIISKLDGLDLKCVRALRAIQAGTGTESDTAKIAELEEQAAELRRQLQEIEDLAEQLRISEGE